jgi:O-antigen/teichoic acid export membrane protein
MLRGLLSLSGANLVYAICQWIPVAILARLAAPDDVALYTLALSIPAPVLMFAQLNLRNVLASDVRRNRLPFGVYRNLRFAAMALGIAMVAAAVLLQGRGGSANLAVVLGAAALGFEWIGDIYQGEFQRQDRIHHAAASVLLRGLLTVIALVAGLSLGWGVSGALALTVAARFAVWFLFERIHAPAHEPTPNGAWKTLLATAWPLGLVMMIGSVSSNLPRYLAEAFIGHGALAAFAVVWALAALGNLVVNSIGQAAMTPLARVAASGDAAGFARLAWMLAGGGLALGAIAVLCGQFLGAWTLGLLYGASYTQHQPLLVAVLGAAGFGYAASLLGTVITAARRFREQIPIQAMSLIAGVAAGCAAMPVLGVTGVAVALAAANATQLAGEVIVLRMALREMEAAPEVVEHA